MRRRGVDASPAGVDAAALSRSGAPLRIVNAMLGRGLGGLEQALLDYGDALSAYGHDVHTVIHPEAAIRPALETRATAWHHVPHLGAWDVLAAIRLRLLLRRLQPDVCIAHGNRAMSLLRQAGATPLIAVLPNYKMRCHGAAAVFHPTQDLKRHAMAQGVAERRLFHIPSMVRVPASLPAHAWRTPPVIGAMGRFVAKKGFDIFIAALGRLRSLGVAFHAVLAGDGPELSALQRHAQHQGVDDALTLPGWIGDKAAFFREIDIFCLPSLHEPFGIVLLEAMAHGKPIVTSDSEGPSEIVRDGHDAILVPRGDVNRLTAGLERLIKQPACAALLGNNARRHAIEEYDLPRVGERLDHAVRTVASGLTRSIKTG